jgi:hypothetical protein
MSASRTTRLLLRLYPPAWRARYGGELEELLAQTSAGRSSPRTCLDLVRSAARERVRSAGLAGEGLPGRERARGGALLVLWAWVLFVLAGIAVEKQSEHWQAATSARDRALPAWAFGTLEITAAVGAGIVVAAIALALPSLVRALRRGRGNEFRRCLVVSTCATAIAALAVAGLAIWAGQLDEPQRNGRDLAYSVAFVACAFAVAGALAAWAIAATVVARRLELSPRTLRLQAIATAGAAFAMCAMTTATVVWWVSLTGTTGFAPSPLLLATTAAMVIAAMLGGVGSRISLGAAHEL